MMFLLDIMMYHTFIFYYSVVKSAFPPIPGSWSLKMTLLEALYIKKRFVLTWVWPCDQNHYGRSDHMWRTNRKLIDLITGELIAGQLICVQAPVLEFHRQIRSPAPDHDPTLDYDQYQDTAIRSREHSPQQIKIGGSDRLQWVWSLASGKHTHSEKNQIVKNLSLTL